MDTKSNNGSRNGFAGTQESGTTGSDLNGSDGWDQNDDDFWDEPVNTGKDHNKEVENDSVAELEKPLGKLQMENKETKQHLERANEELESTVRELESKYREIDNQKEELKLQNQKWESQTKELESKCSDLELKMLELVSREQHLVNQTEELNTANLDLQAQVEQCAAKEQGLKDRLEALEAYKADAEQRFALIAIEADDEEAIDDTSAPHKVDSEYIQKIEQELEEVTRERDENKRQLEGFLSKISSMKTVFQNYKATQAELDELRSEMAALSQEHEMSKQELDTLSQAKSQVEAQLKQKESENAKLTKTLEELKTQSADLNSECDRLSLQLTSLRREYLLKDESTQDEKYALEIEIGKLTKKLNEQKHEFNELELAQEELKMENKSSQSTIEELNQKIILKDLELSRYSDLVQSLAKETEAQVAQLNQIIADKDSEVEKLVLEVERLEETSSEYKKLLEQKDDEISQLKAESAKITSLQEEVHTKQLLIGKLRHEAVILNEHLTKSMGMLKQQLTQSKNTVDRDLISNLILNFVQLPRGDTKKFEALQLIGDLLEWDDIRKVQAGLSQAGGSKPRDEDGRPLRQGFISMWTDFLEKESSKSKPAS